MTTRPSATATRSVAALAETSTMRASPRAIEMGERLGGLRHAIAAVGPRAQRRACARASSARVAAATSFWRIRLSPTRKVEMPTAASRARSAGVKMPLSPTMMRSRGTSGASRSLIASVVSKVLQVAVVDADEPRFQPQRALELGFVMDFDQHVHAEACAAASSRARSVVVDRGHDDEDAIGAPARALPTT